MPIAWARRRGRSIEPLHHRGAVRTGAKPREPADRDRHGTDRRRGREDSGRMPSRHGQHRSMQQRAGAAHAAHAIHRPAAEVPDPDRDGEPPGGAYRPVVGEVTAGAGLRGDGNGKSSGVSRPKPGMRATGSPRMSSMRAAARELTIRRPGSAGSPGTAARHRYGRQTPPSASARYPLASSSSVTSPLPSARPSP